MKNLLLIIILLCYSFTAFCQVCIGEGGNNSPEDLELTSFVNAFYTNLHIPIDTGNVLNELEMYAQQVVQEANTISNIPIQAAYTRKRIYSIQTSYRYTQVYQGDTLKENFMLFTLDNNGIIRNVTIELALDTPATVDTSSFVPDTINYIPPGVPSSTSISLKVNKPKYSSCPNDQLVINGIGSIIEHVFRKDIDPSPTGSDLILYGKYAVSAENLDANNGVENDCVPASDPSDPLEVAEEENFIRQNMYFYTPVQNK